MTMMLTSILLLIAVLGGIIAIGGARMAARQKKPRADTWPFLSVIMPLSGDGDISGDDLAGVLRQDYPEYEVIFSSVEGDAAAATAVEEAMKRDCTAGCRAVRHVRAERAVKCGQKNMNLLAGIAAARREASVLVFCDAGHVFPSDWLRRLVGPLVEDGASVSTSYHHVIPGDGRIGTCGRAVSVLFLHLLNMLPGLSQAWGGSTACKRDLFEELGVGDMWSNTVVDDISLSGLLDKANRRVAVVPSADASTPLAGQTVAGWSDWLTRQLTYLKLFYPWSWFIGGIAGILTALSLVGFIGGMVLWAAGAADQATGVLCLAGAAIFPVAVAAMRIFHPSPGAAVPWICAGLAAVFMACLCHSRTWFNKRIVWRGIEYAVSARGDVLEVRR